MELQERPNSWSSITNAVLCAKSFRQLHLKCENLLVRWSHVAPGTLTIRPSVCIVNEFRELVFIQSSTFHCINLSTYLVYPPLR